MHCEENQQKQMIHNERFGDDEDVACLFATNAKVNACNAKQLKKLGQPIVLVKAKHTGNSKKMDASIFAGLKSLLFLAVFAKAVFTSNIALPAGLCNGARGEIKDFICEDGISPPASLKFVWVNFGEQCKGSCCFPELIDMEHHGWVPIHPIAATEWMHKSTGWDEHTQMMLPLQLAWAWTIWAATSQMMHAECDAVLQITPQNALTV